MITYQLGDSEVFLPVVQDFIRREERCPASARGATTPTTNTAMTRSVLNVTVERTTMELRDALERRKRRALTPYNPEEWELHLQNLGLSSSEEYLNLPHSLHYGFDAGIPRRHCTFAPPNGPIP